MKVFFTFGGSLYFTWTHQYPSPLSLCFLLLDLRQFGPPHVSLFASPQVMVPSRQSEATGIES